MKISQKPEFQFLMIGLLIFCVGKIAMRDSTDIYAFDQFIFIFPITKANLLGFLFLFFAATHFFYSVFDRPMRMKLWKQHLVISTILIATMFINYFVWGKLQGISAIESCYKFEVYAESLFVIAQLLFIYNSIISIFKRKEN